MTEKVKFYYNDAICKDTEFRVKSLSHLPFCEMNLLSLSKLFNFFWDIGAFYGLILSHSIPSYPILSYPILSYPIHRQFSSNLKKA